MASKTKFLKQVSGSLAAGKGPEQDWSVSVDLLVCGAAPSNNHGNSQAAQVDDEGGSSLAPYLPRRGKRNDVSTLADRRLWAAFIFIVVVKRWEGGCRLSVPDPSKLGEWTGRRCRPIDGSETVFLKQGKGAVRAS